MFKGIRGHICEGLLEYQNYSTFSCIPKFDENGFTEGCDDTNYIPLRYCPFCGEKLSQVVKVTTKCEDCKNEGINYQLSIANVKYDKYCSICDSENITPTVQVL